MKILLIDDHVLFREGLQLVLAGMDIATEIYEAGSYETAQQLIDEHEDLSMVLLDLALPGRSNMDALRALRAQLPAALIVVLSGSENPVVVEQVFACGAQGYIPKSTSSASMLEALKLVMSGGTYVPVQLLQNTSLPAPRSDRGREKHGLTPRQLTILQQLATGKSNREIAVFLRLSESTVRAHVAAILRQFAVANRTHAVQRAQQNGWLEINMEAGG